MENFYVYVFLDPRKIGQYNYGEFIFENEPFYAGKGKNGRINWWKQCKDENCRKDLRDTLKILRLKEIIKDSLEPIVIKLYDKLSEENAFELETYVISIIKRTCDGGPLLNFLEGGNGGESITRRINKEHVRRLYLGRKKKGFSKMPETTKQALINSRKNWKPTDEQRRHYSEANRKKQLGKKPSLETKLKQSIANRKPKSEEWKKAISSGRLKPICMMNKNDECLEIFNSAHDVFLKTNIPRSTISACCTIFERKNIKKIYEIDNEKVYFKFHDTKKTSY